MKAAVSAEERQAFAAYLTKNGLKRSGPREIVLEAFLASDRHLSVDDLLKIVSRKHPDIGRTTVYRTLKLLHAAGLARELSVLGFTRFERDWKRDHHDHFICRGCGEIFEFTSPEIERMQDLIAEKLGFVVEGHLHHIFGRCNRCASAATRPETRRLRGER
jgi:Fur family ferric uptake transcriptional regulator